MLSSKVKKFSSSILTLIVTINFSLIILAHAKDKDAIRAEKMEERIDKILCEKKEKLQKKRVGCGQSFKPLLDGDQYKDLNCAMYASCNVEIAKKYVNDLTQTNELRNSCEYMNFGTAACLHEHNMALSYSILLGVATTGCLTDASTLGISSIYTGAVCAVGAMTLAVSDMIFARRARSYADRFTGEQLETYKNKLQNYYGEYFWDSFFKQWKNFESASPQKLSQVGAAFPNCCVTAILTAKVTADKWISKRKIRKNLDENYLESKKLVSFFPKPGAPGQTPQLTPIMTGNTTQVASASGNDTRNDSYSLESDIKEVFPTNSAATDSIRDLYGHDFTPEDFSKMIDAMKKAGIDPEKFVSDVESKGVGPALTSNFGDKASSLVSAIEGLEKDLSAASATDTPKMAFESTSSKQSHGSQNKKDSDGLNFGDLFGNRGPAAETGGVSELKFDGIEGDIYHTGTNLNLFEIVSRRYQKSAPSKLGF